MCYHIQYTHTRNITSAQVKSGQIRTCHVKLKNTISNNKWLIIAINYQAQYSTHESSLDPRVCSP